MLELELGTRLDAELWVSRLMVAGYGGYIGMMVRCWFWIGIVLLGVSAVGAQGPRVVAVGDRSLWPGRVDSRDGFDGASRAAILVYVRRLAEVREFEVERRRPGRPSVVKWVENELALARANYRLAAKSCGGGDWTCVGDVEKASSARTGALAVPAELARWKADMESFVSDYIGEQVRLAALFPRTTSEIELFDRNEFDGQRVADRKFFLTFDDGPTSSAGGSADVLRMLAAERKTAVFFLLGSNLKRRVSENGAVSVANAYRGQCVASHGWEHQAHVASTRSKDGRTWKESVTDTHALLASSFKDHAGVMPLFRPPYAQRPADSPAFFQEQGLHVTLWNLDSQDWNSKLDAEDVTNRIEILMLIKRHGILLFHDIFPKAKTAVPVIIRDFGGAVEWGDCHRISEAY